MNCLEKRKKSKKKEKKDFQVVGRHKQEKYSNSADSADDTLRACGEVSPL